MFGLRRLFARIQGNTEVQKIESEVKDFFVSTANALIHEHGGEILHIAFTTAIKIITSLEDSKLTNQQRHDSAAGAIDQAVIAAGKVFTTNDINIVIENALRTVRGQGDATLAGSDSVPVETVLTPVLA